MLDETLVVWAGEFAGLPSPRGDGRDHNEYAFTVWMAGGGVRRISTVATDDWGYRRPSRAGCTVTATILHLLGLDHEHLTYRFGRDIRLTDVRGEVIQEISPEPRRGFTDFHQ